MKSTVLAIALAVATMPFTFAAQQPAANPPAAKSAPATSTPSAQATPETKSTAKVHKHAKKNSPKTTPASTANTSK